MTEQNTAAVRGLVESWQKTSSVPAWGICPLEGLRLLPSRKQSLLPASGSVLVFALPYYAGTPERNLSLYALARDYHAIAAELLAPLVQSLEQRFPGQRFLPFADNGPIPEVEAAVRAGLGVRGKHGQLITADYGSMVFLAEIVTDLVLTPAAPLPQSGCEGCNACLAACPTGALGEAGLCLERCRSHITQKKGSLTEWEARQITAGKMVWGCDLCTLACPHNQNLPVTPIAAFRQDLQPQLTEENCTSLAQSRSYGWRGEAVLRRNLALISGEEGS